MKEIPLFWTPEALFEKLKNIQTGNPLCNYTLARCQRIAPLANRILALKKEKNAIILAHTYVHPDIIYSVADHVGDSYGLSKKARETDADLIVFPAVHFMAETAKILNPQKTVIDPNPNGGCSLADSISEETLISLKKQYPHHTFICYINTTAKIKALCDVCVTSSNAYKIVSSYPSEKIYFLPDKLMGENLKNSLEKNGIKKEILTYDGSCYVHEEFSEDELSLLQKQYPNLKVIAHPECRPEIVNRAHIVSSTTGMIDYVKEHSADQTPFLLLSECGVASRLQVECPSAQIVGSCMMCKYMRSNSLENILQALESPTKSQIIEIQEDVQKKAIDCLNQMFLYGN